MSIKNGVVESVDGFLLVDKPAGWTSHDVCAFVKKRFRISKVGHAGTLDPMATGLLVLLLGRATKWSNLASGHDKAYAGKIELGIETDSHDRMGKVLAEADWSGISESDLINESKRFAGELMQVPPMVSAIKHQGVRLYELARKGKTVEREPRPITVHEFKIIRKENQFVEFSVRVSKGTYVRTLVHDLGKNLGCLATLAELRRTESGPFLIEKAVDIPTLKTLPMEGLQKKILPLSTVRILHPEE